MLGLKNNRSNVIEAYKSLIINIENNLGNNNVKVIAVVSYTGKQGKTTICKDLSLSLAKKNRKVLLIDCNFRKPSLNNVFKIKAKEGILDVLLNEKDLDQVLFNYNENLKILTAGGTINKQTDIIDCDKMSELLEDLRENYDYIILDTPKMDLYTDAQILAQKSDGVILVVKEAKNSLDLILKLKKKLNIVKANILGIVLNESNADYN